MMCVCIWSKIWFMCICERVCVCVENGNKTQTKTTIMSTEWMNEFHLSPCFSIQFCRLSHMHSNLHSHTFLCSHSNFAAYTYGVDTLLQISLTIHMNFPRKENLFEKITINTKWIVFDENFHLIAKENRLKEENSNDERKLNSIYFGVQQSNCR